MIKIDFTQENQEELFHNFIYEKHPKTRQKNFVVYLKSLELKHNEIRRISRISKPTLASYLKEYKNKGIKSFKELRWKGQESQLLSFKEMIDNDFDKKPPKSVNEARDRIEKLTGIKRSPTQVREFMKKLDYRYLKIGSIPGNGKNDDYEKELERHEFKKKNWNRVWRKLKMETE